MTSDQRTALKAFYSDEVTNTIQPNFQDVKKVADDIEAIKTISSDLNGANTIGTLANATYKSKVEKVFDDVGNFEETTVPNAITSYNTNATGKTNDFNTNASEKTTDINTYTDTKKDEIDIHNSTKIAEYNTNATSKTSEFDTNVTSHTNTKKGELDTHKDIKIAEYNTNATSKTNDFNTNVTTKTNEITSHTDTKKGELDTHKDIKIDEINGASANILSMTTKLANATLPNSGYTQVSTRENNFVFKEDTKFTYKVADKNRYVKIGNDVIDTYGEELIPVLTEGWNNLHSSISYEGEKITIISDGTASPTLSRTINTKSGKHYLIEVVCEVATDNTVKNAFTVSIGDSTPTTAENNVQVTREGSIETLTYVHDSIANNETLYLSILDRGVSWGANGDEATVYSLTVREIPSIDFSNTMPDVTEIITDGSNTTSVAVSKGQFVILKHNFNFDTGISSWINRSVGSGTFTWDSDSQSAKIFRVDGSNNGIMATSLGVSSEKTVALAISIASGTTATGIQIRQFNTSNNDNGVIIESNLTINGGNTYNISYTPSSGFDGIEFRVVSSDGTFALIEKIAYTYRDTFRAIQNAPIGTALTNTAYFQDRTEIGAASQVLAVHRINTLTNSYDTFTEIVFDDISELDLLNIDTVMLKAGYSKVGEYLFRKGTYLVTPIGLWQSLNKGAYHPFLNPFGTTGYVGGGTGAAPTSNWYTSTNESLNSTSSAFTPYVYSVSDGYNFNTGIIGESYHPSSKSYQTVYPDQFIDLRCWAKVLNDYEVNLITSDKKKWGINNIETLKFAENKVITDQILRDSENLYLYFRADGFGINQGYTAGSIAVGDHIEVYNLDNGNYLKGTVEDNNVYTNNRIMIRYTEHVGFDYGTVGWLNNGSTSVIITSSKPVLSSGTKLSIDLIGDPDNYPQVLKDKLASGISCVGINPLLVGQDGTDYTQNTTITPIISKKFLKFANNVYSSDGGVTWIHSPTDEHNSVTNTWATWGGYFTSPVLLSYISKNSPYIQCDPNPVIDVVPKVLASNSHSIYKGADVANQITGKIATGNGTNGLQSKYLENVVLGSADFEIDENITTVSVNNGDTILLKVAGTHPTDPGLKYNVYKRASGGATTATVSTSFGNAVFWEHLGFTDIRLQHNAIQLDNEGSATAKWFEVAEQGDNSVLMGMYGKEIIFDDATWNQDGTPTNTYGDNGEFDQLTNGTMIDTNGNTIKTFHGVIPLYGKGH